MSMFGDILSGVGYALDTPGALTRGLLSGRPGERASGRDMLESWGVLDQNQEGFDWGDVAGLGADLIVDPLNLIGGAGIGKTLAARSSIKKANAASEAMRAKGFMPEEVANLTKISNESGPIRMFHGTEQPIEEFMHLDPSMAGKSTDAGWYSAGTYTTAKPSYASLYAKGDAYNPQDGGKVLYGFVDSRNPYRVDVERKLHPGEFDNMLPPEIRRQVDSRVAEAARANNQIPDDMSWLAVQPGTDAVSEAARSRALTDILQQHGYDSVAMFKDNLPLELVTFNQGQHYAPYIAPALQALPSANPLIAALIGSNMMQAYA